MSRFASREKRDRLFAVYHAADAAMLASSSTALSHKVTMVADDDDDDDDDDAEPELEPEPEPEHGS